MTIAALVAAAENDLAKVATAAEHAAAWVIGMESIAQNDVQELAADSPLIADAIKIAEAWIAANPLATMAVTTAEQVLALVKHVDATSAPTTAPVAGSPADPALAPPVTVVAAKAAPPA